MKSPPFLKFIPCFAGSNRQKGRKTAALLLRMSKKWRNATFSNIHRFCLSHSLPGGKTCNVRKPLGFHPF